MLVEIEIEQGFNLWLWLRLAGVWQYVLWTLVDEVDDEVDGH